MKIELNEKARAVALPLYLSFAVCAYGASVRGVVGVSPSSGAAGVNVDTRLTVLFSETPAVGCAGKIRVYDAGTREIVDSLDLSIPAGPTDKRTYGPECDYTKIPYDYSRTSVPTNRDTKPGTPSGTAEPTSLDYQLNIIGGFTDAFHFYPVIVRGNAAVIYLHNNMLEYSHQYYVTVDSSVFTLANGTFGGIDEDDGWTFTTRERMPAGKDTITVDASGKGDFNTIQGALDYIPDFCGHETVVMVSAGDYEEIVYARNKWNVKIKGEGMDNTKVHYANNEVFNPHPLTVKTNERPGSFPSRRAAFMLDNCRDMTVEDMTIATDLQGQAEGLLVNGERITLYRVHIVGSGDAFQANGTIYMEECELDGGGDTILGRGSLFAYKSNFRNSGGPFTWVRNTAGNHGDVFVECTFSTTDGNKADFGRTVSNHGQTYPYAECVVIDCRVKNIIPEGWSGIEEPATVKMYEYGTRDMTTGELVDVSRRHRFSRQLDGVFDAETIKDYRDPAFVLKGWIPDRYAQSCASSPGR